MPWLLGCLGLFGIWASVGCHHKSRKNSFLPPNKQGNRVLGLTVLEKISALRGWSQGEIKGRVDEITPWMGKFPNTFRPESTFLLQIFLIWLLIFHQRTKRLSISTKPARILKDIEGFFVFFFLLSYLVCSQIWLNHLMDDRHFSYIYITTKLTPKKIKPESSTCRQLEHFYHICQWRPSSCANNLWFLTLSQNTYVLTTEHAQKQRHGRPMMSFYPSCAQYLVVSWWNFIHRNRNPTSGSSV